MSPSVTLSQTEELRRQWSADEAGLQAIGGNPPGWAAFESALTLSAQLEAEVARLRARCERLEAALLDARAAMMEPTGEWHDVRCNQAIIKARAALAEREGEGS